MLQQSNAEACLSNFEVLIEQFRFPLVGFLCRLLGDQRRAEDVAVETLVRLYRCAARGGTDGEFSVVLYRVAIDVAAQRHSARSKDVGYSQVVPSGTRSNMQDTVRRGIAGLHEIERQAVILHKYQNLSCGQIGSVLSLNEAKVKVLLFRAYKTLQQRFIALNAE